MLINVADFDLLNDQALTPQLLRASKPLYALAATIPPPTCLTGGTNASGEHVDILRSLTRLPGNHTLRFTHVAIGLDVMDEYPGTDGLFRRYISERHCGRIRDFSLGDREDRQMLVKTLRRRFPEEVHQTNIVLIKKRTLLIPRTAWPRERTSTKRSPTLWTTPFRLCGKDYLVCRPCIENVAHLPCSFVGPDDAEHGALAVGSVRRSCAAHRGSSSSTLGDLVRILCPTGGRSPPTELDPVLPVRVALSGNRPDKARVDLADQHSTAAFQLRAATGVQQGSSPQKRTPRATTNTCTARAQTKAQRPPSTTQRGTRTKGQ